jgi:hypothetical protein
MNIWIKKVVIITILIIMMVVLMSIIKRMYRWIVLQLIV